MRKEDILKLPSMPASGPSYPAGPYRFIHREFMVITYETDPDIVRDAEGVPGVASVADEMIPAY
jgi:acetoacetate decarboxylase